MKLRTFCYENFQAEQKFPKRSDKLQRDFRGKQHRETIGKQVALGLFSDGYKKVNFSYYRERN